MQPTDNYFLFELAQSLGKTVRELLTGRTGDPLCNLEFRLWQRWYTARARLEQQRQKGGNK